LAPLVSLAYEIYRDQDVPRNAAPPEPPREQVAKLPWSYETYAALVAGSIEEHFSFPRAGFPRLLERARSGAPGAFTDADCAAAVGLFNTLMVRGIEIESRRGDTVGASQELARLIPGLEARLYERVISWLGYRNR
jgi:hypothetical protein